MDTHRSTTDPIPLPASPEHLDTGSSAAGSRADAGGIAQTQTAGVASTLTDEERRRIDAGVRPAEVDAASAGNGLGGPVAGAPAELPSARPEPARPANEDSALESLGKAISAPVLGAAEDEEPGPRGVPRVEPGQ